MLIVTEHQREGEDGTNVAADSVICKSGPVDRSKFNGAGCGDGGWRGIYGFSQKHPDTWIRIGSSYLHCKIVKHLGDGGLKTLSVSYAGNIFPTEMAFRLCHC